MSIGRLTLLAAAQVCWTCLAGTPALAADGAASPTAAPRNPLLAAWSGLWHTADQQGQALLDAGEPSQAAARFHDPRRRAYADLESGRYQEAASLLRPFTDADSEYNRGNALARAGQLQAALAAYDAALGKAPADKDIRHNRDLVERALRQQHASTQSARATGGHGERSTGSAGQGQPGAVSQSGSRGSQARGQGPQSGDRGSPSSAGSQTASTGSGDTGGADSGVSRSASGYDSGSSGQEAGQAQRDAAEAAALARQRQRQQQGQGRNASQAPGSNPDDSPASAGAGARNGADAQGFVAGGAQNLKQKPETERQLALDQWLRQIPDSPAGLLQRKFLIEHMLKQQQESGDQQGDSP